MEFVFSLPESVASEANSLGLLEPAAMERLLREEIRRCRVDKLFSAADRLAAQHAEPMTAAEIKAQIQAAREARSER